ncbi:MAG: glycosyltransferase [Firmicutes bacterium]|nr:glycosyltransferase [Bacillota bacterium]
MTRTHSHRRAPLSVAILLDLYRHDAAGGHVKSWERLAEAVAAEDEVDLTLYSLGQQVERIPIHAHARHQTLPAVLGTDRFRFLDGIADHTDLAPFHPELWTRLRAHDVLHTTDAYFAMARTALLFARRHRRPLVTSLHTDTPGYTRVYAAETLRRMFGTGRLGRWLVEDRQLAERFGARKDRRLERYLRQCDWVLAPSQDYAGNRSVVLPAQRTSVLRRGIDRQLFHPARRDRGWLQQTWGISETEVVLLYAGRLTPDKNVILLARAVRRLLERGERIHTVFAGRGGLGDALREILGAKMTLTGPLPQPTLARLYASADLFALPSELEIFPNVVLEAMASGLPVVVSARGGAAALIERPGVDGITVATAEEEAWAEALGALCRDAERRHTLGTAARARIEQRWPSWRDVLVEDLLPVWRRVHAERPQERA